MITGDRTDFSMGGQSEIDNATAAASALIMAVMRAEQKERRVSGLTTLTFSLEHLASGMIEDWEITIRRVDEKGHG